MADSRDISTLNSMMGLGACYIDCQNYEGGDAASADKMQGVLETLNELLGEEIKEPMPTDSMGGMSAMEGY